MKKLLFAFTVACCLLPIASPAQLIRKEQIEDVFTQRAANEIVSGNWQFIAKLFLDADTPPQITATQNDYNPGNKIVSRLSSNATRSITGIAGGATYQFRILANIGSFDISLVHESSSSTAGNRIISVTGSDLTLGPAKLALLIYDAGSTRWRAAVLGAAGGGGGGSPGGSTGQVQLNVAGAFAGDSGLTYDTALDVLTVLGGLDLCGPSPTNCQTHNTASVTGLRDVEWPNDSGRVLFNTSPDTLTNKNLDCEGTGNNCTIPVYWDLDLAGCVGGTPNHIWNTGIITAPTPLCGTGSNRVKGYVQFTDVDGDQGVYVSKLLPPGQTGALDARILWWTPATTGNVVFQISTSCVAVGEADDASWNTVSTVVSTAQGTTNRLNVATLTGITTTGTANCAENELMNIRLLRNRTHASDTIIGAVNVDKVMFTVRVTH